jgi:hypothetical protein
LEDELFEWFYESRARNIPISGRLVEERADGIACKKGLDFIRFNGWLQHFQNEHGIVSMCISGEVTFIDTVKADNWRECDKPILQNYEQKDIFSCDEIALFFNSQPNQMLTSKGETHHSRKKSKERLLLACNADGSEKLKLLFIRKYDKPCLTFPQDVEQTRMPG